MSGLDLDAIEARRNRVLTFRGSNFDLNVAIAESAADVPVLLARVRELEAEQARLDAACRLLVHSGDLTPVGARQIWKILTEGDTA